MKHFPKTSDFSSIISVSSSHKLALSSWLGSGVASVRGTFGLDCIWVLVFSDNLKNFILNDVEWFCIVKLFAYNFAFYLQSFNSLN